MIHNVFTPFFGDMDLETITTAKIEELIVKLHTKGLRNKEIKNPTINRYLQTLRAILNVHVKSGYLVRNPVSMVGLLPEHELNFDYLSFEETKQLLGYAHQKYSDNDLLFCNGKRQILNLANFKRDHFEKDLKESKIKRIRFHHLRHTFGSHFMMNGGNLYDLQKLMGHSSIKTTERYAHLSPESLIKKTELVSIDGKSNVVDLSAWKTQLCPV